jgi:hypothetical protein
MRYATAGEQVEDALMRVEGQCHCGAIRYEADVEPGTMAICHCLDCQTLTGTAYRTSIQAPAPSFRLLSGEPQRYVKTASSGAKRVHAFCGHCGSPVYACAPHDPATYSLRVGALNQRATLGSPARQIWTKRRLPWVPRITGVPDIDGQP